MSEQATCHKWEQFDGDSGSWQIVLGTGTGQLRYSVLWGYCPTCGSRLDADGTATEMAPVVTFANDNAGPVPCNQEWTKQRIEGLRILLEANGDHHMPPIDTGHVLSLLDALESAQALALQQVGPGHAAARYLAEEYAESEPLLSSDQLLTEAYAATGEEPPGSAADLREPGPGLTAVWSHDGKLLRTEKGVGPSADDLRAELQVEHATSEAVADIRLVCALQAIVAHMDGDVPIAEDYLLYLASLRLPALLERVGAGGRGDEVCVETVRVLLAALQQCPGHAAARHLLGESDEELLDVLERDAYTDDSGDIYIHLRSADIREAARALVAEQKEVPDGTEADSE